MYQRAGHRLTVTVLRLGTVTGRICPVLQKKMCVWAGGIATCDGAILLSYIRWRQAPLETSGADYSGGRWGKQGLGSLSDINPGLNCGR